MTRQRVDSRIFTLYNLPGSVAIPPRSDDSQRGIPKPGVPVFFPRHPVFPVRGKALFPMRSFETKSSFSSTFFTETLAINLAGT